MGDVTELFDAIASPWNLAWVLLVFGFAPGFVLRLLVKIYPKGDPRRAELVAELYAVPRLQRPLWVSEQIEVSIFEGFRSRRIESQRRRRTRRQRKASNRQPQHTVAELIAKYGAESVARRPHLDVKASHVAVGDGARVIDFGTARSPRLQRKPITEWDLIAPSHCERPPQA